MVYSNQLIHFNRLQSLLSRVGKSVFTERHGKTMLIFLIFLLAVIIVDIVALKWGYDSQEGIDSPEWEKRHHAVTHMHRLPHAPFEPSCKMHVTTREME